MELNRAKLITFSIIAIILFFPVTVSARTENCSTDKFSTGSKTQILTFPAGGGYNTDSKVSLPMQAIISSAKVDLIPDAATLIGTPYIWVPQSSGDVVYQIDTNSGIIVSASPYATGNDPSRVTVMPGGDVWVANRNNGSGWGKMCGAGVLSRFSPAVPPAYSANGTYNVGTGVRGVTFDNKGNIWAGDYCDNTVYKFTAPTYSSSTIVNSSGFPYVYGMIGDAYGYIWTAGDANYQAGGSRRVNIIDTKTNAISLAEACSIGGSSYIYGIGMDNQGNVVVANYGGGGYCKIGGAKSGASFGKIIQTVTTASTGSRGIAVDGNNNVWMANSTTNHVYVFNPAGNLLKDIATGYGDVIGVAIDFNNNAWIVSEASGRVLKYGAVGATNQYSVIYDIAIGGSLYNYSDMTGFRSTPTMLSVGSSEYTPASGNTYSGFQGPLQTAISALANCSCKDANGVEQCAPDLNELNSCLVPLSLFSITGGNYTATNLNISCSITYPDLFGGLVPCARLADNPATADIDESKPCNVCAMFYMLKRIINFAMDLSVGIGVFILIISGLLYALSAGNPRRIELAKSGASSVIAGIIIVFIAWLAIAVILQAMGYANVGVWNQVSCAL